MSSRAKEPWAKTSSPNKEGRGALIKAAVSLQDLSEWMNRTANRVRSGVCEPSLKLVSIEGRRYVEGLRFQPDRGNPAVRDDRGGHRKQRHGREAVWHQQTKGLATESLEPKLTAPVLYPTRSQSCYVKSQEAYSLDGRVAGNQHPEAHRQHHRKGDGERSGRNESERRGGLESAQI